MKEVRGVHLKIRTTLPLQDRCMLLPEGGGAGVPTGGHLVGILSPVTVNGSPHQWSQKHQPSVDDRGGKGPMTLKWIGRFSS